MGKGKKKPAVWLVLVQSCGGAIGIYLLGTALVSWLIVRGSVPEGVGFPVVGMLAFAAAFANGAWAAARTPWATLPSALLAASCFAGVLLVAGLCCWDTVALTGQGGILLCCVLGGGAVAGLVGGGRKRHRRRA